MELLSTPLLRLSWLKYHREILSATSSTFWTDFLIIIDCFMYYWLFYDRVYFKGREFKSSTEIVGFSEKDMFIY